MHVENRENIFDRLPEQYPVSSTKISNQQLFWEHSFPCPYLRNDIRMLRDGNFELAAALARVEQAAAVYGMAESALMPTVEGMGEGGRSRVRTDGDVTTRTSIDFKAVLNWEFDIWGRLSARRKAAALSLEEEQSREEQMALNLEALLVESWVVHHGARRLERILIEQRLTNKQFLNLTELRLALGQGNALAVLQQQGRQVSTERELPAVLSRKRRAANAYAVFLGHLPDGGNLLDVPWPVINPLGTLASPQQLLVNRPDLRTAFLALQAADYEVAAAIADRLPTLSIGLSCGVSGGRLDTIGKNTIVDFTSALLAPVFDAGYLKAKVSRRKAEVRELLALLKHAILVAVQEVEDILLCENALFDEQELLKNEIAIALDTVEKARLCYVNGQETYLAVLLALADLQTLQKKEITLQQTLLINRSRLLKALGAKWSEKS